MDKIVNINMLRKKDKYKKSKNMFMDKIAKIMITISINMITNSINMNINSMIMIMIMAMIMTMVNNIIMNTIMIMTTKDISINKNFYENLR
jgi:hypothetical protein